MDEIVARLSPAELGEVINIVGRSPSCYPPGVYAALKGKKYMASPPPQAGLPPKARRPLEKAANEHTRPLRKTAAALHPQAADAENGAALPVATVCLK